MTLTHLVPTTRLRAARAPGLRLLVRPAGPGPFMFRSTPLSCFNPSPDSGLAAGGNGHSLLTLHAGRVPESRFLSGGDDDIDVPAGTFHGDDDVPVGTFHGDDDVPVGTFH